MPTVFITGASRGLGLEFARQYRADGWRVIGTCRNPHKAEDLADAIAPEPVQALDVAKPEDISRVAAELIGQPIDVLIANAGVMNRGTEQFDSDKLEAWIEAFQVNTIAPFLIIRALLPNLLAGPSRVAAVITSRMGSIEDNTGGSYYAYRSSKAALNAVVKSLSIDLRDRGIIVTCFHPGWVRTAMGGPNATLVPAEAIGMLRSRIAALTPDDSGAFLDPDGQRLPW